MPDKIEVQNVNTPGKITRVDAGKYHAMLAAMQQVVPSGPPGMTARDIQAAVKPHLPDTLFPGGATAGWWVKCVQLDMEAKGTLQRHETAPLTFSLT